MPTLLIYFCRIVDFGEDILNHSQVEEFQYGGFDLEL